MNKQSPRELSNDQLDAVVGGTRGARNGDDYGDDHRRRGHDHDRGGRGHDRDHDRGGYY